MAEQLSQTPGFKALEQAVTSREQVHTPEQARERASEHIKSVITQATLPTQTTTTQTQTAPPPTQQTTVALEKFVQLAFNEGIAAAVQRIIQTNNPYLIDAFHDLVVDKFVQELKASGKLK